MRASLLALLLLALMAGADDKQEKKPKRANVLVELFTSQG